jgi:tetratricopeptide (TPR) repeat protein
MQGRRPAVRRGRRLPGIRLRPGSVRQARLEAGLTLAEVAGGGLTRQHMHLIETGRSRPSLPTLERIAEATGRQPAYFLPTDVIQAAIDLASQPASPKKAVRTPPPEAMAGARLSEALVEGLEALVLQERWQAAVVMGRVLLGGSIRSLETRTARVRVMEAKIQCFLGQACLQLRLSEEAVGCLSSARKSLQELGESRLAVVAMHQEFQALWQTYQPTALLLGEQALEECRRLRPPEPELEADILTSLGGFHVAHRQWQKALASYRRAERVATSLLSLRRKGLLYQGLKIVLQEMGKVEEAADYAHKTVAVFKQLQDTAALGRAENNLGVLLMRTGNLGGADRWLRAGVKHLTQVRAERDGLAWAYGSLADLQIRKREFGLAEQYLKIALPLAQRINDTRAVPRLHKTYGDLHAARGRWPEAEAEYEEAVTLFEELGLTGLAGECRELQVKAARAQGREVKTLQLRTRLPRPDAGVEGPSARLTGQARRDSAETGRPDRT